MNSIADRVYRVAKRTNQVVNYGPTSTVAELKWPNRRGGGYRSIEMEINWDISIDAIFEASSNEHLCTHVSISLQARDGYWRYDAYYGEYLAEPDEDGIY